MSDDPRKRTAMAICREDDTVPLGRPPGVPRTVAAGLHAECRAAMERVLVRIGLSPAKARDAVTVIDDGDGPLLFVDFNLGVDEERVARMATLTADITPHPSALDPREAAVRDALQHDWQTVEALAAACKLDREDTLRILRALKRRGMAWDVGGQWRVP